MNDKLLIDDFLAEKVPDTTKEQKPSDLEFSDLIEAAAEATKEPIPAQKRRFDYSFDSSSEDESYSGGS